MADPLGCPLYVAKGTGRLGGRGGWMDEEWTPKRSASTNHVPAYIVKTYVWTGNWMEPQVGTGWTRPPYRGRPASTSNLPVIPMANEESDREP